MTIRVPLSARALLACGLLAPLALPAAIPAGERQALLDFYAATDGAGWTRNTGWNGAAGTECSWFGVGCDAGSTHVLTLRLPDNHLTGQLTPLGGLPQLLDFEVQQNLIAGTIPPFTGVPGLQTFYAYDNRLSGSIPALSGVPAMVYFAVHQNQLSGTLPSLAANTHLVFFYVSENFLSGSLPSLSGLTALSDFVVHRNQFTGPLPALTGLGALRYLYANDNQLSGSIPSFAGLASLEDVTLQRNQLSGALPSFADTPKLDAFFAFKNNLSGPIPTLSGLTKLRDFEVFDNQLSGPIPSLSGLTTLYAFYVYNNRLTGGVPSLDGLDAMQYFAVNQNQLTGSLPRLAGHAQLHYFYAYDNQLTGTLPDLSGLTLLSDFVVNDNRLSGTIPSLTGLSALRYFYVYDNQLTGALPDLSGLASLQYLAVENNQLTGAVPSFAGLGSLTHVYLYGNQFSGPLPPPPSPSALVAGGSRLCPNSLDNVSNAAWDAAAGLAPWYRDCTVNPQMKLVGTLQTKAEQSLQATAGATSYEWSIDGDGAVGRSGSSNVLPLTFPTAFNGTVSVTATTGTQRTTTSLPVKTEAQRLVLAVTDAPTEDCGTGDGTAQAGKRFTVPFTVTNQGSVALRDGYAVFVARDRYDAASAGQGIAGQLNVETPLVAIGSLAPGSTSDPLRLTVSLGADAACGTSHSVLFKGGVDANSFSIGSGDPLVTFDIPAGALCHPYAGTCTDAGKSGPKALVTPRQGLYLNPNRSGNGLSNFVIPVAGAPSVYFGAWFTGGADRNPTWYIIQGPLVGNTAVAPIYKFNRDLGAPGFAVKSAVVGQAVVALKGTEQLALFWQIGARSGTELMEYFVGGPAPADNRTGAWYDAAEPGWGQVVHQYDIGGVNNSFIVDYIYDAAGEPRWVLTQGPTASLAASSAHQTFQVHCPGCVWIADWNNLGQGVGNGSELFTDPRHGTATTSFTLPAPYAGTWTRNNAPLDLLTTPQ